MARASLENRIRAVVLCIEGVKDAGEISSILGISVRTFWRRIRAYRAGEPQELALKKPGPESRRNSIPKTVEERIVSLEHKHPLWGVKRIKYQYNLPCDWRTVHMIIKRRGMLARIKLKPLLSKRFQRKHVCSMWHLCNALDSAKQFIAEEFKEEVRKHGIKLFFGKLYHPRGRGKIERYHEILWQELKTQKRFSTLPYL